MKNRAIVLIVAVLLLVAAIYVLTPGAMTGFLARTGQFSIGNTGPSVYAIYLNNYGCSDSTPTDCTITGVENTTKAVTVKVTVEDSNGNCDEFTSNNGTAIFCDTLGQGYCDETNAKHIVTDLEYDAGDGQWGANNQYCNLTGSAENWQFYEVSGDWNITVKLTDGSINDTGFATWYYNEIRGIVYPASGSTVSLGALTINLWNNGTGQALMQNSGNIILDLNWNATDFTGQAFSDVLAIDGTNFAIDDDTSSPGDIDNTTKINDVTSKFYDYSYSSMSSSPPPGPTDVAWTNSSKSTQLDAKDGVFANTTIVPDDGEYGYAFQLFGFPRSFLAATTLNYKGFVTFSGGGSRNLNIWNQVDGVYDSLTTLNGTNAEYEISLTKEQISNGIVGGKVYFMVSANDGQDQTVTISSDYIEIGEVPNQDQVFINDNPLTTVAYEPATGLFNCSSVACSNTNATMNYYWHLFVPTGLHQDTYTDIIQVSTSDHTDMRLPGNPGGGGPV